MIQSQVHRGKFFSTIVLGKVLFLLLERRKEGRWGRKGEREGKRREGKES
jgi:hypothetical protein